MIDVLEELLIEGEQLGMVPGKMFGAEALVLNGKAIVCVKREMVGFKLGEGTNEHFEALALPHAELFDPSGKHRPFRDWVAIPLAASETAVGLLGLAVARSAKRET